MNRDDLKQKAKDATQQHGDKADGAIDKGSEFAKSKAPGQEGRIDTAADKAKEYTGRGNNEQW